MFAINTISLFVLALSQTVVATTHVVSVGEDGLVFAPDTVDAAIGDLVQFQFYPKNHSVVQSTFDHPCVRANSSSRTAQLGFSSGYMPTLANATTTPTYTITVNDTNPIWMYCSQAKHCEAGMVMAINAPTSGDTFASFKAKAISNGTSTSSTVSTASTASTATASSVVKTVSSSKGSAVRISICANVLGTLGVLGLFF